MKIIKCFCAALLSVVMLVVSISGALAATSYTVGGYSFNILNNSEISLCGWDNSTPELIVPAEIVDRELVEVTKFGLEGNTGIYTLDFSQAKNLTTIGYGAFMDCSNISNELTIPGNVTVIGYSAFENCSSIPSLILNANVKSIQNTTFKGCTALETVYIKGYTQSINYQAFANCPNLKYIEIPNYVTSISVLAFADSPNVTIGCYYGSYAQQYAIQNSIPYILLDGALLGDANGDGYVNVNDVTAIQRHAAELEPLEGICFHAADVDGDGDVSVDDATELQRYLAEYAVDYPVGEIMTR